MDKWTTFTCSVCKCEFQVHKHDTDTSCPHCGSEQTVEQPSFEEMAGVV